MGQAKARRAVAEAERAADPRCMEVGSETPYVRCSGERGHEGPHVFACPEWLDYQVDCCLPLGHAGPHRFEWSAE